MATNRATTPGFRDARYRSLIQRLIDQRKALGVTQQVLADRLGLHKQFVSRVETHQRRLDVVEFADWARALSLSPGDLTDDIPERA